MTTFKIKTPNGEALEVSGNDMTPSAAILAEILLEICAEQGGIDEIKVDEDEIAGRMIAKGWSPYTGEPLTKEEIRLRDEAFMEFYETNMLGGSA